MDTKIILFLFMLISADVYACKPAVNFIAPSLEENFKKATYVFKGKILAKKDLGQSKDPFGTKYALEFQVEKKIKGKLDNKTELDSYANSCDKFGYDAEVGYECVVFVSEKQTIISGLLSGDATVCEAVKEKNRASLINERIHAIQKIIIN